MPADRSPASEERAAAIASGGRVSGRDQPPGVLTSAATMVQAVVAEIHAGCRIVGAEMGLAPADVASADNDRRRIVVDRIGGTVAIIAGRPQRRRRRRYGAAYHARGQSAQAPAAVPTVMPSPRCL